MFEPKQHTCQEPQQHTCHTCTCEACVERRGNGSAPEAQWNGQNFVTLTPGCYFVHPGRYGDGADNAYHQAYLVEDYDTHFGLMSLDHEACDEGTDSAPTLQDPSHMPVPGPPASLGTVQPDIVDLWEICGIRGARSVSPSAPRRRNGPKGKDKGKGEDTGKGGKATVEGKGKGK